MLSECSSDNAKGLFSLRRAERERNGVMENAEAVVILRCIDGNDAFELQKVGVELVKTHSGIASCLPDPSRMSNVYFLERYLPVALKALGLKEIGRTAIEVPEGGISVPFLENDERKFVAARAASIIETRLARRAIRRKGIPMRRPDRRAAQGLADSPCSEMLGVGTRLKDTEQWLIEDIERRQIDLAVARYQLDKVRQCIQGIEQEPARLAFAQELERLSRNPEIANIEFDERHSGIWELLITTAVLNVRAQRPKRGRKAVSLTKGPFRIFIALGGGVKSEILDMSPDACSECRGSLFYRMPEWVKPYVERLEYSIVIDSIIADLKGERKHVRHFRHSGTED